MKERLKIFPAAAVLAAAAALCSCGSYSASSQGFAFDTYYRLTVDGTDSDDVLSAAEASLEEMSEAFGLCYGVSAAELPDYTIYKECFDETASLNSLYGSKINVACGALTEIWGISTPNPRVPAEREIEEAMEKINCGSWGDFSEGMKLDFGAVSKGFACDKVFELLENTGTDYAVVSLSSTTLMYGAKPREEKFRAGIVNPLTGEGYMGIIETDAAFISTSGGYERYFEAQGRKYSHILDISTGRPAETDLASATVIVPADVPDGGLMSDYLATLIYIEGTEGLDKWLDREDFRVVAVASDGAVYSSCEGLELDESGGFYYG